MPPYNANRARRNDYTCFFVHEEYTNRHTIRIASKQFARAKVDSSNILELLGLFVLLLLAWLWFDSLKAREAAVDAARTACEGEGLLFLDDTVGIASLKLARDGEGRLKLQRAYDFEYSDTGNNRIHGSVVMLGHRVMMLNVGLRVVSDTWTHH